MPSIAASLDDDPSTQDNQELVEIVIKAVQIANSMQIDSNLNLPDSKWFNIFPGEHYRLLAGLIQVIKPKSLVDIGTSSGMSARVMIDYSQPNAIVTTFDIEPWHSFPSHLNPEDFRRESVKQKLLDLSKKKIFEQEFSILNDAEFIFCDAPKDGRFEYALTENMKLKTFSPKKRYLLLDDIRFVNMLPLWRNIRSPKLDITSFGHFSGTGIVDISKGLDMGRNYQITQSL